jgi:Na+/melibiose symporter-like transporter
VIGWGSAFLIAGANVFFNLEVMGDDPRCMIGWRAGPKWGFFMPMILILLVGATFMWIVNCNIDKAKLRTKKSEKEFRGVKCQSLTLFLKQPTYTAIFQRRFFVKSLPANLLVDHQF